MQEKHQNGVKISHTRLPEQLLSLDDIYALGLEVADATALQVVGNIVGFRLLFADDRL